LNSKPKILITGASGYIGSRAFEYLKSKGFEVFGLSRDGGDFITGDFGDINRMTDIINDNQIDIVLHCGGVTPHAHVTDDDYFNINFERSKNLLEACALKDIKFINASTIGVYGVPLRDGVVSEDDDCHPLSPYAQSKYDFEMELQRSDVPHVNIRIANIPGRDSFINYVVDNNAVNFFGDAPYIRDYIHLDDLTVFFERSINYLTGGGESVTVNAGSGFGYSFPAIVDEIERQSGTKITRQTLVSKSGDVVKIICDISKAQNILNWVPQNTDLEDIITYALHNK